MRMTTYVVRIKEQRRDANQQNSSAGIWKCGNNNQDKNEAVQCINRVSVKSRSEHKQTPNADEEEKWQISVAAQLCRRKRKARQYDIPSKNTRSTQHITNPDA